MATQYHGIVFQLSFIILSIYIRYTMYIFYFHFDFLFSKYIYNLIHNKFVKDIVELCVLTDPYSSLGCGIIFMLLFYYIIALLYYIGCRVYVLFYCSLHVIYIYLYRHRGIYCLFCIHVTLLQDNNVFVTFCIYSIYYITHSIYSVDMI